MANYVFLMQFDNDTTLSDDDTGRLRALSEIGSGFSMIGCVMSLSLLCFLPVQSDGLFIMGNMSVILLAAQLSFIGAENTSYPDPVMCKIATALIHYLFLAVHFASVSYAVHLWFKLGMGSMVSCRRRGFYLLITWLLPFFIVLITVITRGGDYAKSDLCWLPQESNARLSFLIPMSVALLINGTLFVLLIRARIKYDLKKEQTLSVIVRHAAFSVLSLFPSLSLQWIFGYSVTFDKPLFFQYLYVILCSGQGMMLLVCHVLTNGQVRKALCAKVNENGSEVESSSKSKSCDQRTATEVVPMPMQDRNEERNTDQ